MKNPVNILIGLLIALVFTFNGCSNGGGNSDSGSKTTVATLSGVAQKGAFVKDSSVSLCKLDKKMACTQDVLKVKVRDDKGSYEFTTLPWSGLSRLTINGYYFDELTGNTSLSPATITAIINIKSKVKQKGNTNLLTDMRAKRMRELVTKGKSLEVASEESKGDVKKLFNIKSDDFTALNLVDFSQGNASVNVELLRISAAVANAEDPVAVLEELMKIYNEYGIEGVLNSRLYKELMGLIKDVDVKGVLTQMVGADEANAVTIADIAPFAIANVMTYGVINADSKVRITLIGTEFIGAPSISVTSSDNLVGINTITLADDNKSAILDMNRSTSCEDVNLTFTVDSMELKDVDTPIRTSQISYMDENTLCVSANTDDVNSIPVTINPAAIISLVPQHENQIRLSLLGTEFENYEGSINAELITSSTTLAIVNTEVSDNNKSVVFTLNEDTNYCADNNVTIGLYTFNLKGVPNESDTFKSNKISYVSPNVIAQCGGGSETTPIDFNRAPTVTITPSTVGSIDVDTPLELNATAIDPNSADTVTLQWRYKNSTSTEFSNAGTTAKFSHAFDSAGHYIVKVTATDNHDAETNATVEFDVLAVNHAPTVSISPSGDKNINVGDSVILKSHAADEDDDALTISWKVKEQSESTFTSVPLYGATGFKYTFDAVGTYTVVVEAEDGNGSKADANITVNVSQAPAVVMTLNDINISVEVKGHTSTTTGIAHIQGMSIVKLPTHGNASAYLVGGEYWSLDYTNTDCFIGADNFVYKVGDDYGRINVTITSPSSLTKAEDVNRSIFNTDVISREFLVAKSSSISVSITTPTTIGSSSLIIVGNEDVTYSYDPDENATGDDYFIYTVNETINSCSYSDTARVSIEVKAPLGYVHLFNWYDDVHGGEIWRTDGTVAGTAMVKDIWPGTYGGGSIGYTPFILNSTYYFGANDGNHSTELWRSDGTESGTYMVKDINPGKDDGSFPYQLSAIGDTFYFFARTGDNNGSNWKGDKGLWKSDGTEAGTLLVEDFGDDSKTSYMGAGYLQSFGNHLLFVKDDAAGGGPQWEPWISDGSSSASKLKDIWPGEGGSNFRDCLELQGKCYAAADDSIHGSELWLTDGTETGTVMLKDINENNNSNATGTLSSTPTNITIVGNKLFFVAFDTIQGISLWKSDGNESGTVMVKDSFVDENETSLLTRYEYRDNYGDFIALNSTLYFILNDGVHGKQLWKSDGTEAGTVMVKDMGSTSAPSHLTVMNNTLYFWFTDDTTVTNSGLYKTDGTAAGTLKIKEFSSDYDTGYEMSGYGISEDNGKLYFEILDYGNSNTKEYWVSDGTEAGTFKLVDGESMGGVPQ